MPHGQRAHRFGRDVHPHVAHLTWAAGRVWSFGHGVRLTMHHLAGPRTGRSWCHFAAMDSALGSSEGPPGGGGEVFRTEKRRGLEPPLENFSKYSRVKSIFWHH
jgi:hypothetical protein